MSDNPDARWRVSASKRVYNSPWVEVWLDDVETPEGTQLSHHVVKFPRTSVGAVVLNDDQDHTLLLRRHRYITDTWGWEIPAGWGDPGEEPIDTARREVEEETGYRPIELQVMTTYKPMAGISTMHYTTFLVTHAEHIGHPTDQTESVKVEWIPVTDVPKLTEAGQITDGPSITSLAYYLGIHRRNYLV